MKDTPWTALWKDIEEICGPDQAAWFRERHLARERAAKRAARKANIPLDAPRQRAGRKRATN